MPGRLMWSVWAGGSPNLGRFRVMRVAPPGDMTAGLCLPAEEEAWDATRSRVQCRRWDSTSQSLFVWHLLKWALGRTMRDCM